MLVSCRKTVVVWESFEKGVSMGRSQAESSKSDVASRTVFEARKRNEGAKSLRGHDSQWL
jgi:hypothetical protein